MRKIELQNLIIRCIIGVLAHERHTLQRVEVSVTIHLRSDKAARSGSMRDAVDYAKLAEELRFILQAAQFYLLETAVDTLAKYIITVYAQHTSEVEISISKPDILANTKPRATVALTCDEVDTKRKDSTFGYVDTVHVTEPCGMYILNITPQNSIPTHYHVYTEEHEMVLTSGLHLQRQAVNAGTIVRWPRYFPHRYDNYSDTVQKVLCIDKPAFQQQDVVSTDCEELRLP
ncbi:MAG: dihydroneopterin aldolase [Pseudomonadota bacterium]|nr:dihydroneopterin aldolase [Pseudomonadota bacterium]